MSALYQVIGLTTLFTAFIILVLDKTELRDDLVAKSPKFLSKLLSCDFCLGFWLSMALCLFAFILTGDLGYLCVPFFSAPLIRLLV